MNHSLQKLSTHLSTREHLTQTEISEIKGGRRYVTKNRYAFEAKRNELQNKQACMCITHVGNTYCIEW